jgi:hypothetical protein
MGDKIKEGITENSEVLILFKLDSEKLMLVLDFKF